MKTGIVSGCHVFTHNTHPNKLSIKYQIVKSYILETQCIIKGSNKESNVEQCVLRKKRVRDCVFEDLDRICLRPINKVKLWSK